MLHVFVFEMMAEKRLIDVRNEMRVQSMESTHKLINMYKTIYCDVFAFVYKYMALSVCTYTHIHICTHIHVPNN